MLGDLQVCLFNHSKRMVHAPWAMNDKVMALEWDSMMPGGYGIAKLQLRNFPGATNLLAEARIMTVNYGLQNVYAGRISDPEIKGNTVELLFFGGWEHMGQRLVTDSYAGSNYADDIIKDVLTDNCPLISSNYSGIGEPNFDVGAISWTRKSAQEVVTDLMATGDDQTPPNEWYFACYEADPKYIESSEATYQVEASTDDAMYDNVNGYDDGGNDVWEGDADNRAGQGDIYSGYRFDGVAIPQGATVTSATFSIYLDAQVGGTVSRNFHCEDADDAATFAAGDRPDGRTATTAYTTKSSGWDTSPAWNDVDITTAVQEVVDRAGWATGQAIVVLGKPGSGTTTEGHYYKGVAWDDDDTKAAKLVVKYYTETVEDLTFRPYYSARPGSTRTETDYLILPQDVEGPLEVTRTMEGLYNSVIAKYGGSSYTAAATDTDSQGLYDVRQNDPETLDAGDNAVQATAEQVRDLFLEMHKDPQWRTGTISTRRIRDRWGNWVHPATVRPGCIIRLQPYATFDPDSARCFWVVKTHYDAVGRVLTLTTEALDDSVSTIISQIKRQAEQ